MSRELKNFYDKSILFRYGFTKKEINQAIVNVLSKAIQGGGEVSIDSFVETLNKKRTNSSQLERFVGEAMLLEFEESTGWLYSEIHTICYVCSHEINVIDQESQFTSSGFLKCVSCDNKQPFVITEMIRTFYLTKRGHEVHKLLLEKGGGGECQLNTSKEVD